MPPQNDINQSPAPEQPVTGLPPDQTPVTPADPSPSMAPPPASKSKLPVIAAVVVAILLIGGIGYALTSHKAAPTKSQKPAQSSSNESDTNKTKANEFTATSLSDYSAVCQGGAAANAASYSGAAPHTIVLLSQSTVSNDEYIESSMAFKNNSWLADYKNPAAVQLVGCLSRKSESASTKTCQLQDSDNKNVSVPLVPVVYSLTVYEAKTGKKLGTKDVPGPVSTCPFIASYNPSNPKIYGDPDPASTETAVTEFVTK